MIPPALVSEPTCARRRFVRAGVVVRWVGAALLTVGIIGVVAWASVWSPLPFERWSMREAAHNVTFDAVGTYVLFEEGDGASEYIGPARVSVSVRSIANRELPVRDLVDDAGSHT